MLVEDSLVLETRNKSKVKKRNTERMLETNGQSQQTIRKTEKQNKRTWFMSWVLNQMISQNPFQSIKSLGYKSITQGSILMDTLFIWIVDSK